MRHNQMFGYVKRLAKQPGWLSPSSGASSPLMRSRTLAFSWARTDGERPQEPPPSCHLDPLPAPGARGASPGLDPGALVAVGFWRPSGKRLWAGAGGQCTRPGSSLLARKQHSMLWDALSCKKNTSEMHVLDRLRG